MKKALLLASLCVPALVVCADKPEELEDTITLHSTIKISKDTPPEVRRAIRMELEESCRDMKEEFEMLEGIRVESKCVECGCGVEEKNEEKPAEEKKEVVQPEDADKGCPCAGKPKPKK